MEPLLISTTSPDRGALNDLAVELASRSAGFRHSFPAGISAALTNLVRAINCYYSNLIEGHNNHPIDIALLYRGKLPRGDVASLLGTGDRQARRIVAALAKHNVVVSHSARAPLRMAFPAKLAPRWMPALFPEQV